jgi:hypothetical protein
MSIDIHIEDHSGDILNALNQNIDKALEAVGLQAAGYAALNLERDPRRVDTGLLRNSIAYAIAGQIPIVQKTHGQTYQNDGHDKHGNAVPVVSGSYQGKIAKAEGEHSVYVGTNVEYGIYVHEGAHLPNGGTMEANRFLRDAVSEHKDEYKRLIETVLKGEL